MPRTPFDYVNTCHPNADVLAADARVVAGEIADDGLVNVVSAMWKRLHDDLARHSREAYHYLATPEFAAWVTVCGGTPDAAREQLMEDYWGRVSA